ncbi:MAG: Uma2 family endonuclease [Bacteroidota bacterium]
MIATKQESLHISFEEYLRIEELVEGRLEYDNGKIVHKEGSEPLPDWVVRELLKPDFDDRKLDFEFPQFTMKHTYLIHNLFGLFVLNPEIEDIVKVYVQDPQIITPRTCRVPDLSICPEISKQIIERESIVNPIVLFEVLSPFTASKDRINKLDEYLSIESLQEYFLVSQEEIKIERYGRTEGKRWEYEAFREGVLPVSSVEVELELGKIYKDIF